MGDALTQNQRYSVEAYETLAANAGEGERYEYTDGQLVVKDEYTSDEHNLVLLNVYRLLHAHFGPKGCKVFTENVHLAIDAHTQFRLPDVMVTCLERDKTPGDAKRDPLLLVELLSASSAFVDLVDKAKAYKTIPGLRAYLIVKPDKVWVGPTYATRPAPGRSGNTNRQATCSLSGKYPCPYEMCTPFERPGGSSPATLS